MVLISTLLILASVSLIAFGLAGDSTTEARIAGNRRLHQQAFDLADGGANVGVQVLLDYLDEDLNPQNDYPGTGEIALIDGTLYLRSFTQGPNILDHIMGYSPGDGRPDVSFDLYSVSGSTSPPDSSVTVDINRLSAKLLAGSSIEFAAGYEGVGKGAGTGSIGVYYAVDSIATAKSAKSDVTTVYRKVSNVIAGAQ